MSMTEKPIGTDLIYGVRAIADEIRRTERQTRHLIDNGAIQVGRMGRTIIASRSGLRRQINKLLDAME